MKHKNNGISYFEDFRQMIVELYHSGQKVKDLSSENGVSDVTIYSWIPLSLKMVPPMLQKTMPNDNSKCEN